ncbi:uncharacterized protein EV420DRAFT_1250354, partial [Desarmillaria tabescens]
MVGSKMLVQISAALCEAKEDNGIFGGINIIFAGGFAQLSPVGDSRIFSRVKNRSSRADSVQKHVLGKLLWFSVNVVVILHKVMRQEGTENADFTGKCVKLDWNSEEWENAPLIVSENAVKDAYNDRAARSFADRTGRQLHYYYSVD